MAIQTTVKKSYLYWNLLYFVLCAGLGAWGAYDYWIDIPAREEAVVRYAGLTEEFGALETRGAYHQLAAARMQGTITPDQTVTLAEYEKTFRDNGLTAPPPPLTDTDKLRYREIEQILDEEFANTPPEAPASYDRWVNLWVYVVGTGILGAPYFGWKLLRVQGKRWRLDDDGALTTPEGSFPADDIQDIDMSIWMKKSIARVRIRDREEGLMLDDFVYQDAYLIVGALAHRFHPDEWTTEAKPVKDGSESSEEDGDTAADEVETDDGVDDVAVTGSNADPGSIDDLRKQG